VPESRRRMLLERAVMDGERESGIGIRESVLAVLKPNRLISKRTDANCSSFHLRVFLGLSNPQGQRQTSILSIPCDNLRKQK
jgi:hypothetical protein